jgi:hypothetical protein
MFQGTIDILTGLESVSDTVGHIAIDCSKLWFAGKDAFYVLQSVKGVSNAHAFL